MEYSTHPNIRESNSLNEFNSLIKFCKPETCIVAFLKITLLKWVLFDLIYIEAIIFDFQINFFYFCILFYFYYFFSCRKLDVSYDVSFVLCKFAPTSK